MALTKVTSGGLDGTFPDDSIVNADVNSSAAIALSKLATDPSNATNLASGTVPTARLGSGTASSSTVLYGDQTYKTEPGGGKILQVVQTTSTSSTAHSSIGSYTASAISGAITPTAASSKIFISIYFEAYVAKNPSTIAGGSVKIYRDIESAGYAALYPSSLSSVAFMTGGASGERIQRAHQTINYLDSPSYTLTDVITYKLYGQPGPSGYGNITTSPDGDSAAVILMEVGA